MAKWNYSRFVHTQKIVQSDLPRIATDDRHAHIFNTFRKYSQLSKKDAVYVLTHNKGPSFELKPIGVGTWGEVPQYPPPPKGRKIWINPVVVQQYERIKLGSLKATFELERWQYLADLARLYLESTLLHELVHWGDQIDGITSDSDARSIGYNDIGHQFVEEAYEWRIPFGISRHTGRAANKAIDGWMGWDGAGRPHGLYSHIQAPLPSPPPGPCELHPR